MSKMVGHLKRMPLKPRLGMMVATVVFALVEIMDVVQMFASPDDDKMIRALSMFPRIQERALGLLEETQSGYALMRVNTLVLALLAGLIAARFAGRMSQSLLSLRDAAQRVANGDLETTVSMNGPREVRILAYSIDQMRIGLASVVRLARENAALRKDVALGEAAQSLLTPRSRADNDQTTGLVGFPAASGNRAGFWWHHDAKGNRRHVVLGCVEGSGPAAVMSLAALAGAVRDELLHVSDVDPRGLVTRAHELVSSLTKCSVGLCIVTIDLGRGEAHFVSAGACAFDVAFHKAKTQHESADGVETGSLRFDDQLALMLGPMRTEHSARAALEQALAKSEEQRASDVAALLHRADMPAAVVVVERVQGEKRRAA